MVYTLNLTKTITSIDQFKHFFGVLVAHYNGFYLDIYNSRLARQEKVLIDSKSGIKSIEEYIDIVWEENVDGLRSVLYSDDNTYLGNILVDRVTSYKDTHTCYFSLPDHYPSKNSKNVSQKDIVFEILGDEVNYKHLINLFVKSDYVLKHRQDSYKDHFAEIGVMRKPRKKDETVHGANMLFKINTFDAILENSKEVINLGNDLYYYCLYDISDVEEVKRNLHNIILPVQDKIAKIHQDETIQLRKSEGFSFMKQPDPEEMSNKLQEDMKQIASDLVRNLSLMGRDNKLDFSEDSIYEIDVILKELSDEAKLFKDDEKEKEMQKVNELLYYLSVYFGEVVKRLNHGTKWVMVQDGKYFQQYLFLPDGTKMLSSNIIRKVFESKSSSLMNSYNVLVKKND